jgi:hypothetical protein
MAGSDDDDWGELRLEPVPLETPPARPMALRAYFADVGWDGFYREVKPWTPRCLFWCMAKRLQAVEALGGHDIVADVRPTHIEWRR